jgi:two-component sensor histidine kinase
MRAASTRQVKFGGRIWEVAYARPERDDAAIQRGFAAGMAAMLLLLAIVGIALYLIDRNRRLQQALIAHGEAEEQLKIIAGELAHRVKNAYMVALALASQTLGRDDQEGLRSFSGRMRALAKAADALTDGRQQSASLRTVLEAELPASDQIACNGPDISMPADAVQNIHLMFHELATNAAKHGALATADGRVRVDWQLIDGSVNLVWQEVCDSAPADLPSQKGFGRSLLETMVPEQLHGTGELSMTAEGLRYAIRFPFPHPVP